MPSRADRSRFPPRPLTFARPKQKSPGRPGLSSRQGLFGCYFFSPFISILLT